MNHRRGISFDLPIANWRARSASEEISLAFLARASGSLILALMVNSVAIAADEPDEWRIFRADSDSKISALAIAADRKTLAVGGDRGEVVIVNSGDGLIQQRFQAAEGQRINAIALLANDHIAVGDDAGRIAVWRLSEQPVIEAEAHHPKWITSLAVSPDGKWLAASDATRTVRLWELPLTTNFAEFAPHPAGVKQVAFASNGQRLIASTDRAAIVWDVETRKPLHELKANGIVRSAQFTPDCATAMTVSEDGAVRMFDIETGERKRSLTGHAGMVWCLDISPDGQRVATGGFDQTVRVWDIETGDRQHIFRGPKTPVIGVKWSRGGEHLYVASEDQLLRRYALTKEAPQ